MIFLHPPAVSPHAARTSCLCMTLPGYYRASTKRQYALSTPPTVLYQILLAGLGSRHTYFHHMAHLSSRAAEATATAVTTTVTATTARTTLFRSKQTQTQLIALPSSKWLSTNPSQLYHTEPSLSSAILSRYAYRNSNYNHRYQSISSSYYSSISSPSTAAIIDGSSTPLKPLLPPAQPPRSALTRSGPRRSATCSRNRAYIQILGQERTFHSSSPIQYSQPYFAMKNSHGDTLRVHLAKSRDFVGLRSTRCQRKYNQDRYKVVVLDAPQLDATATATTTVITAPATGGSSNSHTISQIDANHKTLFYFAIFDGHGGSNTADYLTANLDHYIESAKPEMVPQVIKDLRKIGGYFRNFRPHFMEPFLPLDFEKSRSGGLGHQRKVHIPGKGGKVRPMIFIPHPNATEAEQEQEIQSLEMATNTGVGHSRSPATLSGTPLSNEQRIQKERAAASLTDIDMNQKAINEVVEEEVYDEYHDPLEITKRRNLNRTSPLPEGTTPYFGTDRSEYALLSLRKDDKAEKERRKIAEAATASSIPTTMTLEQRLCLAFLKCDTELIQDKYRDGSTASVVIVQSKGAFWETKDDLDLIIAHVGDTRILLCEAPRGESIQLTTDHHPDAIVESERIRKMAAYVSADSFGENMFLGQLANTRALGDIAMKPFGVSAEPELIRRTVKANEAAFLVLISDGISSVMSNQEVVDCVKLEDNPTLAAANVLNLAEQLGAEDNCTVMVVKLPAWGTKMPDLSKELREYRWLSEAQQSRARRR